jgi:hypothetical protein
MVSCGMFGSSEPESAQELYDKIIKKMDAIESVRTDISIDITFHVSGYEVKSEGTGYSVEIINSDGEFYFYEEITTRVNSVELSVDEKQKQMEAYYDGNYFISREQGDTVQKMYSPMTTEEVIEYLSEKDVGMFDYLANCTNKSFEKVDGGDWQYSCSGFTKIAIDKIVKALNLDGGELTAEFMDINFVLTADEKYRPKELKIDFVFEEIINKPSVSILMAFSQYGSAEAVTEPLDTDKFTEVDDVRVLGDVEEMLREKTKKESGRFALTIDNTVRDYRGESSTYTEENIISYGKDDGGYFYNIDALINQELYTISYKNGRQTIELGSEYQENIQSEQEAREWIIQLMNNVGYDPITVTDIESKGEGVYKLTCGNTPTDFYEEYFENYGASLYTVTEIITVTIKFGNITQISSNVTAKGSTEYGMITLTTLTKVTF